MSIERRGRLFRYWEGEQPEPAPEGWELVKYETLRGYGGQEIGKVPVWRRKRAVGRMGLSGNTHVDNREQACVRCGARIGKVLCVGCR